MRSFRNIRTVHAEDGSGVGSAIIAGMRLSLVFGVYDLDSFAS